jgi:hypothetical protein
MLEGLRTPEELLIMDVTLLRSGCPPQILVHAFHVDERTVARWVGLGVMASTLNRTARTPG